MNRSQTAIRIIGLLALVVGMAGCKQQEISSEAPKNVEFTSAQPVKTQVPAGGSTFKGVADPNAYPAPPGVKVGDYRGGLK